MCFLVFLCLGDDDRLEISLDFFEEEGEAFGDSLLALPNVESFGRFFLSLPPLRLGVLFWSFMVLLFLGLEASEAWCSEHIELLRLLAFIS